MLKDVLRTIKNDMWDTLSNKKYVQAQIKELTAEIERERKEALSEYINLPEDDWYRAYGFRTTNEAYNRRLASAIDYAYSQWHNDQMYYLIYKDGSEVVISAEEILGGVKFPKVSDVVYAEMSSADDHMDTETGDLHWYSDERMAACDWDYDVEGEAVWQYEAAIQFKFGTEWAKRWAQMHPEFVPMAILEGGTDMFDLRKYKDTAKAAVARERELDDNWGWSLKAVNKNEIRIGWGYLDYIGEKDLFTVVANDEDDVPAVIGTIPNGEKVYAFVGPKHWHDYRTIEEAVAGVIHSMAASAHNTY